LLICKLPKEKAILSSLQLYVGLRLVPQAEVEVEAEAEA
jgi:hypothetical protein